MRQAAGDGGPEVTYFGGVGLRPADGGIDRYYNGIEDFAGRVDRQEEVDENDDAALAAASVHFLLEEDRAALLLRVVFTRWDRFSVLWSALANRSSKTATSAGASYADSGKPVPRNDG